MGLFKKKKYLMLGTLALSSTFYGYSIGEELVTNGTFGFASGTPNITGWTENPGDSWTPSSDQPLIPSGSVSSFSVFAPGNGTQKRLQQTINITTPGKYALTGSTKGSGSGVTGSIELNQGSSRNILNSDFPDGAWSTRSSPYTFNLFSTGEYTLNLFATSPASTEAYFGNISLKLLEILSANNSSALIIDTQNAENAAQFRNDVVFGTTFTTTTLNRATSQNGSRRDFQPQGNRSEVVGVTSPSEFSEESLVAARNTIPSKNVTKTSNDINVWGTLLGQYMHQKKASNSNGFSSGSGGAIAGADWTISNQSVGFAASYVYTYFGILNDQGHSNINQGTLATYGVFRFCNWISNVSILGGYAHDNNHRHFKSSTTSYHTHGSSNGWQLSPHLDLAYNAFIKNAWFNVVPYVMGDYVANWQSKYSESGSADGKTSQGGKFYGFVRAESGLRFYETINVKYGKLILKEKGAYAYQRSTSSKSNSVSIIGTTNAFVVPIGTHIQNLFVGEFSMEFVSGKKYVPDVEVSYEGQFGSKFIAQIGTINLSKKF